ncbi:MAG: hypothetical protein R3A10_04380 [Caldilineaceae bacterium]
MSRAVLAVALAGVLLPSAAQSDGVVIQPDLRRWRQQRRHLHPRLCRTLQPRQ